jgi:hypothetical protein
MADERVSRFNELIRVAACVAASASGYTIVTVTTILPPEITTCIACSVTFIVVAKPVTSDDSLKYSTVVSIHRVNIR